MRWFHWLALGILAVVLFAVAEIAFYPDRLNRDIDARVAAIRASGAPISTSDLVKSIPNDRNAAILYLKSYKLLSDKNIDKQIREASDELSSGNGTVKSAALVRRYDSAVWIAEQASRLPECSYPIDWSKGPLNTEVLYYKPARSLVRLLALRSAFDVKNGDADDSIRSLSLAFKVADSLKSEPALIGFLVDTSSIWVTSAELKDSLKHSTIHEDRAKELYDLLDKIEPYEGYRTCLLGERAQGIQVEEEIRYLGMQNAGATDKQLKSLKHNSVRSRSPGAMLMGVRACRDERCYLDEMQRQIDLSSIPYRLVRARHLDREPKFGNYDLMASLLVPSYGKAIVRRDETVAEIDGDKILLALTAYKDRCNSYPASLDELHKKLGWAIPNDIFSGEDYRYRRVGKGFLLYSIGPNLKDDGGMDVKSKDLYRKGDMVWRWDR
jgi:hypothetical protein